MGSWLSLEVFVILLIICQSTHAKSKKVAATKKAATTTPPPSVEEAQPQPFIYVATSSKSDGDEGTGKIEGTGPGGMKESKACKGVKCFEPGGVKNCTAVWNNSTKTVPNPTASCCPTYVCSEGSGQAFQYSASSGNFGSGPPPGFFPPGAGPGPMGGGFGGQQFVPPPYAYGPPMGMPMPMMPGPGAGFGPLPGQNFQYQQAAKSAYPSPPGGGGGGPTGWSSSSSYSYSYGDPNSNNSSNTKGSGG